jgi:glycosyltransferase involved in cell wall biosynthesis
MHALHSASNVRVGRERCLGRSLPGEGRGSQRSSAAELLVQTWAVENVADRHAHREDFAVGDEQAGISDDLRQGGVVERHHRDAAGQSLKRRQAEARRGGTGARAICLHSSSVRSGGPAAGGQHAPPGSPVTATRRVLRYMHRLSPDNPTGVHRVAVELTRALTLHAPEGTGIAEPTGIDVRHPRIHRRLLHASWTLAQRPLLERFTGRADVVHPLTPGFPLPSKAPLVSTILDLIPMQSPERHAPRVGVAFERSVRHAAANAAMIIVPSQVIADDVRGLLGVPPSRLRVIPEGVDRSFASPVPPELVTSLCDRWDVVPGRFLLIVGEISDRKNLAVLLAALRGLEDPPTLVVAGARGPLAGDIDGQVVRSGVGQHVRLVGRVSDEELRAVMQSARALIHASVYEGFGLTPVEAMVAGTATIVSSGGSLPEVVGDASLVLDPRDDEGWAAAIRQVCEDDALVGDLVARGPARVADLSWQRTAEQTLAVYEQVWS